MDSEQSDWCLKREPAAVLAGVRRRALKMETAQGNLSSEADTRNRKQPVPETPSSGNMEPPVGGPYWPTSFFLRVSPLFS